MSDACMNTDRVIWQSPDDMRSRQIKITEGEGVTLCAYGQCVTMPFADLHRLAYGDIEARHAAANPHGGDMFTGELQQEPGEDWVPLAKALFAVERDENIKDQQWFDFEAKAVRLLAAIANPQQ